MFLHCCWCQTPSCVTLDHACDVQVSRVEWTHMLQHALLCHAGAHAGKFSASRARLLCVRKVPSGDLQHLYLVKYIPGMGLSLLDGNLILG